VLVAGRFTGSISFDGGTTLSDGGRQNVFLAKYDTDGSVLRAVLLGGTGTVQPADVRDLVGGGVLMTGWFDGTLDIDGVSGFS